MLAHNQILPLIEIDNEGITKLFKKCFLPIQKIIKDKIIEIESNFVNDIIRESEFQVEDKSVMEKFAESKRE